MNEHNQSLETLQDIKKMMERSSRFISLSGLSGVAAGICALFGAWFAYPYVSGFRHHVGQPATTSDADFYNLLFASPLFRIAVITFIAAFITAFIFSYIKSRKEAIPIWDASARRLMLAVSIPMIVGGIFLLKLLQTGNAGLVAPGCLIFYGLALLNGSKYTLSEIKYLALMELVLGIVSLWFVGEGIYFWAVGFGLLHIVYGIAMWLKYERK
jgi:hypothetical protein